jgi:pilus assembly protein CpaB
MVFGLVLIVGLGLAGFAVYMAQGFISHTQAELARERAARKPPVPMVSVFVAKKDLAYGDTLTPDDVVAIAWPKAALPATAFTELKTKDPKDTRALFVEGSDAKRTVLHKIAKFEPILVSNVTKPGESAGITARLAPGMRAFALKVNVASGV